jgi:hypothetical protein
MKTRLAALALVLLVVPVNVEAAGSNKLRSVGGKQVFVIDRDHVEWQGRLLESTDTSITIETSDGVRRFLLKDVVRVDADGDRVRDGIIKGAIFGGAVAGIFVAPYAGAHVIPQAAFAYALMGGALDAMNHSKQTVYRGASPQLAFKVSW